MFLRYGNYQHDAGECVLTIFQEAILSERGTQTAIRETWEINGRIHATDQAAVSAAQATLIAAYAVNGQDAGFYLDDGSPTNHVLVNANSLYGIKVIKPPSFPKGDGGEFSTYRNYQIVLMAEFPYYGDGASVLLNYAESISFQGVGGPVWHYLETLNGPPQAQTIRQMSVMRAVQSGFAEALGTYPGFPGPIWPELEHQEQRTITYELPNDKYNKRVVRWSYHFSSDAAMNGFPIMFMG